MSNAIPRASSRQGTPKGSGLTANGQWSSEDDAPGSLRLLYEFLRVPSSSLLIKGLPGTGKTTLAMKLLRGLPVKRKIYISTRVSREKVRAQLPAQEKSIGENDFMDLRLDSASSVLEQLAQLSGEKDEGQVVVIDSWDAFGKELETIDRLKTEKTMFSLAAGATSHFIFVSEEPGKTTIDYLVDGVVELMKKEQQGRIVRECVIDKLRGVGIKQDRYVVTLLNGDYLSFDPYPQPDYSKVGRFHPIQDRDGAYSYGSEDMDRTFGGLAKGSTLTVEYTEDVPYSAIRSIELSMILNSLAKGRAAVLLPMPGSNEAVVRGILSRATDPKKVNELFGFLNIQGSSAQRAVSREASTEKTANFARDIASKVFVEYRKKSADGALLQVACMAMIENLYASNLNGLLEDLSEWAGYTQASSDVLVSFIQSDSPLRSRMLSMSSSSIKMFCKNGSVMMMGIKPYTPVVVMENVGDPVVPSLTWVA